MPGDVRNDLYLRLERGEFERGGKSTGKNIEVNLFLSINNCYYYFFFINLLMCM